MVREIGEDATRENGKAREKAMLAHSLVPALQGTPRYSRTVARRKSLTRLSFHRAVAEMRLLTEVSLWEE